MKMIKKLAIGALILSALTGCRSFKEGFEEGLKSSKSDTVLVSIARGGATR